MTIKDLKKTEWAADFRKERPTAFSEALTLASSKDASCRVYKTAEFGPTLWAVESVTSPGFCFFHAVTHKRAVSIARSIGLNVVQ